MKLKTTLFLFMSTLCIIFTSIIWMYSNSLHEKINTQWAEQFIKKQLTYDKNRVLLPIMDEVALVKEMAKNPAIIAMALNEDNPKIKEEGIKTLEQYRLRFQDQSYFAAFVNSQNYYFNDHINQYSGKELHHKLSSSNKNDSWFYDTISKAEEYEINVDKDVSLGVTKVWINYLLYHEGEIVGIIGTGIDFDYFLNEYMDDKEQNTRNLFISKDLTIQLGQNIEYLEQEKLSKFVKDKREVEAVKKTMKELEFSPNNGMVKTLKVNFEGQENLIAIAYIQELGWFSVVIVDSKELVIMNSFSIFLIISVLFIVALIFVAFALNILILNPIDKLKNDMNLIQKGEYSIAPSIVGTGEIAELSKQFKDMVEFVRQNNMDLDAKVKKRTAGLMESEQKLSSILDSVDAYIYIKDTNYAYIYANKQTCKYLGKPLSEIVGKEDKTFFDEITAKRIRIADKKVLELGQKVSYEEVNTDRDGDITTVFVSTKIPLFKEDGSVYALCGISTDISERKKAEELIKNFAFYDSLTGLPNRRMLEDRLTFLMAKNKRNEQLGALLFMDLDNFKPLNDTYGHEAGDALLIEMGERISSCVREVDTVARFGGDEFIVALGELDSNDLLSRKQVLKIAHKILETISVPCVINVMQEDGTYQDITHVCTASIGATLFNKHERNKERIFQRADKAMYLAKQNGRNRVEFIQESQASQMSEALRDHTLF